MQRAFETAGPSLKCSCSARGALCIPVSTERRCVLTRAKKEIHPKYYDEAKVICNGEEVLTTSGTQDTYTVDVWSGNHPFYTQNDSTMITDEGRVSRFNKRFDGLTIGKVAPSKPGDKKLDYKTASKKKQQKGGKK